MNQDYLIKNYVEFLGSLPSLCFQMFFQKVLMLTFQIPWSLKDRQFFKENEVNYK